MKRKRESEDESSPVLDVDILGVVADLLTFRDLKNFRLVCSSFAFAVRKLGEEYFRERKKAECTFVYRGVRSIPNYTYKTPHRSILVQYPFAVSADGGFHVIDGRIVGPERVIYVSWNYLGPPGAITRPADKIDIRRGSLSYSQPTYKSFRCSDGRTLNFGCKYSPVIVEGGYAFFTRPKAVAIRVNLDTMVMENVPRFNDISRKTGWYYKCQFLHDGTYYGLGWIHGSLYEVEGTDDSRRYYTSPPEVNDWDRLLFAFVDSESNLVLVTNRKIYRYPFGRTIWNHGCEEQPLELVGDDLLACRFGDDVLISFPKERILHRYVRGNASPITQLMPGVCVTERIYGRPFMISNAREGKLAIGCWGKEAFNIFSID